MKKEIYLILNNIRSRENVGSIFRTADAAGVSKIYLCGITPRPPHEKITKTALGADNYVPWEYYRQPARLISQLKDENVSIYALELSKKSRDLFKFKPNFPMALIVGNEVKGISPAILRQADEIVAISMRGGKESLNVSVATGVALFQLINSADNAVRLLRHRGELIES